MKKALGIFVLVLTIAVVFTGWSGAASTPAKIDIKVGTGGDIIPFAYVDKSGTLVGYEIEMVQLMGKEMPQYNITFQIADFPSLFAGLDSNRYQVLASNIFKRPEREAKYLFASNYHYKNTTVIVVKEGRTDIKTLDDLAGKKAGVGANITFNTMQMEKYNKEHTQKPIILVYVDTDPVNLMRGVETGAYDAYVTELSYFSNFKQATGAKLQAIPMINETFKQNTSWLLFRQDQQKMRDDFDKAFLKIQADGTLNTLSKKYFGSDYKKD
jgi:ABC-type amino acid transport substrate-binding protein